MDTVAKTADAHLTRPMYTGQPMAPLARCAEPAHPLEASEAAYAGRREARDLELVRAVQGKAAALAIAMEYRLAGQSDRLPGLPSSNLHRRILCGLDVEIGFEDQLNLACHSEVAGQPHALMEKRLGLL